jgi:hypothetical protein
VFEWNWTDKAWYLLPDEGYCPPGCECQWPTEWGDYDGEIRVLPCVCPSSSPESGCIYTWLPIGDGPAGTWELTENYCPPGCECADPPVMPGNEWGETVRVECVCPSPSPSPSGSPLDGCVYEWVAAGDDGAWWLVESNCPEGCTCEPPSEPGFVHGERVTVPCICTGSPSPSPSQSESQSPPY